MLDSLSIFLINDPYLFVIGLTLKLLLQWSEICGENIGIKTICSLWSQMVSNVNNINCCD